MGGVSAMKDASKQSQQRKARPKQTEADSVIELFKMCGHHGDKDVKG
jgi:hypothetical protein